MHPATKFRLEFQQLFQDDLVGFRERAGHPDFLQLLHVIDCVRIQESVCWCYTAFAQLYVSQRGWCRAFLGRRPGCRRDELFALAFSVYVSDYFDADSPCRFVTVREITL